MRSAPESESKRITKGPRASRLPKASKSRVGKRKLSAEKTKPPPAKKKASHLLLQAVEGVRDYAIFMLDPEGRVATWNQGAARIKGYTAKEIVGQYFSIFYPQEEAKSGKCEYELEEAKKTGRYEEEGWRVRKDGTQFWANVVITAIRDQERRLLGFTKVTRDLTEKKRAEDRLQLAYADLERRVMERTADLARANISLEQRERELTEAVRVRDEFLSIASHELKTPITSLMMQLQILQQKTKPELGQMPTPERLAKYLVTSLGQMNKLSRLVEDLLDVARAQAQKLHFRLEKGDLRALVEEVVERMRVQAEAAGCRVKIEGKGPVEATFDHFRIDQVIVNLLTNALKYAPGTEVTILARAKNGKAELGVRDQGPGIPLEERAKLFERFERGSNARNIGGLGLGLFITKQIAEGHRGSVRAEGEPGKGTTFLVEFPLDLPAERNLDS